MSAANIAENLTPMADRYWVAEECAMRLADDAAAQKVLLEYCLNEVCGQWVQNRCLGSESQG